MAFPSDLGDDDRVARPGNGMSPAGWRNYNAAQQRIYSDFLQEGVAAGMSREQASVWATNQFRAWGQNQSIANENVTGPFGESPLVDFAIILGGGLAAAYAGEGAAVVAEGSGEGAAAAGGTAAAEGGGSAAAAEGGGSAAAAGGTAETAGGANVLTGAGDVFGTAADYGATSNFAAQATAAAVKIATQIGTNVLITYALGLLAPKQSASEATPEAARGALVNAVSNVEPINPVYGSRRKGCALALVEVTGASNEYLNLVCVWGEGPVSAIGAIYLNDVAITDTRFSGLYDRYDHLGTDAQAADAALVAEIANSAKWSSLSTLSGVAYTYLRLKWSATAFPGGLPNITADLDGRTLYDPRDGTTSFKHNPALAIRDYLTNARYGRGIASAMIDDTAFQAAANTCDAAVSIPGGGTQARYTADGIVNVDDKPLDNLRALLTSCRGFMVFSGGLYKLKIEQAETPVSLTLSEDNLVGAWSVALGSKAKRYNRAKARFFDAASSWQPNMTAWPEAGAAAYTTYLAQDNGLKLEPQLELPFTSNAYRACQIAQIEVKRSRLGIIASCSATIAAMALEVGDVVPVTHATYAWSAKLFRVVELELEASDEVRLTLLEYDAAVYTLDALTAIAAPPAANLPNPNTVQPPGVVSVVEAQYVTANPAGVKTKVTLTWGAAPDIYVQSGGNYQVEYQAPGVSTWKPVASTTGDITSTDIFDVAPGVSGFRVKALNSLGVPSAYVTATQEIYGLNAAPSDIASFAVQAYNGMAKLTWDRVGVAAGSDLAVNIQGRVYVRWAPATSGAVWADGVLVNPDGYAGDKSLGEGPLQTGTYMAKAWNGKSYSASAASFVVTEALITGALGTLATKTESPTFTGSKTNVDLVSGALQLVSDTLIDSILTNIDTWGLIDSYPGIATTGSYAFAGSKMDLGSVRSSRLYASITSSAFDTNDLIDNYTNLIDSWGLIDGTAVEDAEVKLMVRKTDDDPNGAPSWGPWHALGMAADYSARGFDFRLDFTSGNVTHNRAVSTLTVTAKG